MREMLQEEETEFHCLRYSGIWGGGGVRFQGRMRIQGYVGSQSGALGPSGGPGLHGGCLHYISCLDQGLSIVETVTDGSSLGPTGGLLK